MIKVFCAFMKVRWQFPVSNFLRNFGDTTPSQKTWILNVEPFWKIKADLSNVSLKIESYDPNQYVNGDRLSIQVESSVDCEEISNLKIIENEDEKCVYVVNKHSSFPLAISVSTPPMFDVDVDLRETSSLAITNLESISLLALIENGDVNLHNVKAQEISVISKKGSIASTKILLGNVKLKADNIYAEKIQSPDASLQAVKGNLQVRDAYTDNLNAAIENGNITLQSVHGKSKILIKNTGNISAGTVEGDITAITDMGNIDIHIAAPSAADLSTNEGNVRLSTAPDVGSHLNLSARDVIWRDIEIEEVKKTALRQTNRVTGILNGGGPLIKANAMRGIIQLQTSTWMQRILKFGKGGFKAS